jgi:hypothetical protein
MPGYIYIILLIIAFTPFQSAAEPVTVFVVHHYSFDYATNPKAPEIANSLCGTRCNAMSSTLNSYMMAGGWRLVKSPGEKTITITIETPFIEGNCFCIGEEYVVTKDIPLPDSPKR